MPPEISYGMQKRVSLARTLAPGPNYLLFDEPTTGLDPITTNAVNDLIFDLSRKLKVTSVVVSHDMACALKIADRILVLDQARILALGTPCRDEALDGTADPRLPGRDACALPPEERDHDRHDRQLCADVHRHFSRNWAGSRSSCDRSSARSSVRAGNFRPILEQIAYVSYPLAAHGRFLRASSSARSSFCSST